MKELMSRGNGLEEKHITLELRSTADILLCRASVKLAFIQDQKKKEMEKKNFLKK